MTRSIYYLLKKKKSNTESELLIFGLDQGQVQNKTLIKIVKLKGKMKGKERLGTCCTRFTFGFSWHNLMLHVGLELIGRWEI